MADVYDIDPALIDALAAANLHNKKAKLLQLPHELLHRVFLSIDGPDRQALLASCRQLRVSRVLLEEPRSQTVRLYDGNEEPLVNTKPKLPLLNCRSVCLKGAYMDPTDSHGYYEVATPKMLASYLSATLHRLRQSESVNPLSGTPSVILEGWDLTIQRPDFSVPVIKSIKEIFPSLKELTLKGVQYEQKVLGYSPAITPLLSRLSALRICEDSRTQPSGLNAILRCCASFSSLTSLDLELSDFGETDFGTKPSLAQMQNGYDYGNREASINVGPLSRLQNLKSLTLKWILPELITKVLVGLEGLLQRLDTLELHGFKIPPMTAQGTLRSLALVLCQLDISFFGCMNSLEELGLLVCLQCKQGDIKLSLPSVMSALSGIGSLTRLFINLDPFLDSILECDGQGREASAWASKIPEFNLMRARGVEITVL